MSDDSEGVEESLRTKKNANSAKLPYFHRVLSDHDKALIGDTTPKALNAVDAAAEEPIKVAIPARSAWNVANTWEEKDCSAWAHSQIELLFSTPFSVGSQQCTTSITGVSGISGSAQINQVRGKTRYLYELAMSLNFEMSDELHGKVKGKMLFTDLINDMLDDMDVSVEWFDSRKKLASSSKNAILNDVKKAVIDKMRIFEDVFSKKFKSTVPSPSCSTTQAGSSATPVKLNLPSSKKPQISPKKVTNSAKTRKTELGSIVLQACGVAALLIVGSLAMTYWKKNR
jgi:activator of HSP90 ATPase